MVAIPRLRAFGAPLGMTALVVPPNVQANHLFPDRPVVRVAVPDAQRVPDPLLPEDPRELPIVLIHRVALPDREDEVLRPERGQASRIVLVLHEVERVAGVDVL